MKTFLTLFTLSILFCFTNKTMAQCEIFFSPNTQSEVDDFASDYSCDTVDYLYIIYPSNINDLYGLQQIEVVMYDIYIVGTSLGNLSGLENIHTVGGDIHIFDNDFLTNVSALQNIDSINGSLFISVNPYLSNLSFNNLITINGDLFIGKNAVNNLNGFSNLSYVGGSVSFDDADFITNLIGLENLTEVGESFQIKNNASLANLTGLSSIVKVNQDFIIEYNSSLLSLDGLENLDTINSSLQIKNNSIDDITALQNLKSVGGTVVIESNQYLSNLTGLDNISDGPTEYIINNNAILSNCRINSICNHLEQSGNHSISNNASGCNSGGEINAVCNSPITEIDGSNIINVMEGDSITFTHSSFNYDSLVWIFDNAPNSVLNSPTVLYDNPGTFIVTLETANMAGFISDSVTVVVSSIENSLICTESTLTYPNPSTFINNTVEKVGDLILMETGVDTIKIESGDSVKLRAGERITINSNFSVKQGASASFYIEGCMEDCSISYFNNLYGGSGNEILYSFINTNDGGFIGTGFSRKAGIGYDAFFWLIKLSNSGEVEWENTYPNVFETYDDSKANSIKQTQDGGYIIVGYVDVRLLDYYTPDHKEIGILKVDEDGNLLWSKQMHNIDNVPEPFFAKDGSDTGRDIIQNKDGEYIVASYTVGGSDDFKCQISKLDSLGNLIWYNEELEDKIPEFIEQSLDGNYIVGGYTSWSNSDIWLAKLDSSGNNILWLQVYTVSGTRERARSFVVDKDGGYTISGYSNVNNSDNYDIWIIKTDKDGEIVWDKFYGGDEDDYTYNIYPTFDGGYIFGGYTRSSNNGDVGGINKGYHDAWVVKLDALGNIEWENLLGSDGNDQMLKIVQTCEGGYVVCGYTSASKNGDVIDTNSGDWDAWIVKLDPYGNLINDTE